MSTVLAAPCSSENEGSCIGDEDAVLVMGAVGRIFVVGSHCSSSPCSTIRTVGRSLRCPFGHVVPVRDAVEPIFAMLEHHEPRCVDVKR